MSEPRGPLSVRLRLRRRDVALGVALVLLVLGGLATTVRVQGQAQERSPADLGFPDLVAGLKATPGCLGVETARTTSGKQVIFAWFEDKQAVLRWYNSDMHQGVVKKFFPGRGYRPPLEAVPDDSGPLMAIASITLVDKAHFEATSLPISQIAIELYQPVTGGIFLGGRFAPDSLKLKGMRDVTPRK